MRGWAWCGLGVILGCDLCMSENGSSASCRSRLAGPGVAGAAAPAPGAARGGKHGRLRLDAARALQRLPQTQVRACVCVCVRVCACWICAMSVCVRVGVCALNLRRECMRACVCVCACVLDLHHECVHACVRACMCVSVPVGSLP